MAIRTTVKFYYLWHTHEHCSDVPYYLVLLRHKKLTSLIEVFSPCASTNITDKSVTVKENLTAVRCDVHVLLAYNTAPIYSSVAAIMYSVTAVSISAFVYSLAAVHYSIVIYTVLQEIDNTSLIYTVAGKLVIGPYIHCSCSKQIIRPSYTV
jgi:hypothetical protein